MHTLGYLGVEGALFKWVSWFDFFPPAYGRGRGFVFSFLSGVYNKYI